MGLFFAFRFIRLWRIDSNNRGLAEKAKQGVLPAQYERSQTAL